MVCSSLKLLFYRINAYNQEQTSFKKIKPVSKTQTDLNIEPQHMFHFLISKDNLVGKSYYK